MCDPTFTHWPFAAWWWGWDRPGEVYTTQLRQAVEKLRLELPSLVGGDCGQPKRDIQLDSRARDTVSAVMSGMGKASDQSLKRSTAVRQY